MNSRERVIAAARLGQPDKLPLDFLAVDEVRSRLMEHFGFSDEERLLKELEIDVIHVVGPSYLEETPAHDTADGTVMEDYWGVRRKKRHHDGGAYWEPYSYPLNFAESAKDLNCHPWPDPDHFDYQGLRGDLAGKRDYCVNCGMASVFYRITLLREMSRVLMDMYLNPELVDAVVGRLLDFQLAFYERLFTSCRGFVDIFYIADDYGTQRGLMFDPQMWRRFFRTPTARLVELAHRHGLLVMLHSCGGVRELIGEFIDVGANILDPVQSTAVGMDIQELKREYGRHICFHGAVDTQGVLNFGTRQQVREHVARTIEVLAENGGYIMAPCHNIQVSAPTDNILAMYEAARGCR